MFAMKITLLHYLPCHSHQLSYPIHPSQTHSTTTNSSLHAPYSYDSYSPFMKLSHSPYCHIYSSLTPTYPLTHHLFPHLNFKLVSLDLPFGSGHPCWLMSQKIMMLLTCLKNTLNQVKNGRLLT